MAPYGPTELLLQKAREWSDIPMHKKSTLAPLRQLRGEIECSSV